MYDQFIEQMIPYIERMVRIFATPYKWNSKGRKFILIRDRSYVKVFRMITFLCVANTGFVCWNVLHVLFHETSIILVMWSLFSFAITIIVTKIRLAYYFCGGMMVEFHNASLGLWRLTRQRGKCLITCDFISCVINDAKWLN
jgi:hypothetical protein